MKIMSKKVKLLIVGSILLFAFSFGLTIEPESSHSLTLKNVVALAKADTESGGSGKIYCAEGCVSMPGVVCLQCSLVGGGRVECTFYDNHHEFGTPYECDEVVG